jgi:hypothetical protein
LKIHSREILRDLSPKTEANEKPQIGQMTQTTEAKDLAKVAASILPEQK